MLNHVKVNSRRNASSLIVIMVLCVSGLFSVSAASASAKTAPPKITGDFQVGSTLTAVYSIPTSCKSCQVKYVWLRATANSNGTATSGYVAQPVTGSSYVLTNDDLGKLIVLQVSLRGPRTSITFTTRPSYPIYSPSVEVNTETNGNGN
jgi:hypothetical protein